MWEAPPPPSSSRRTKPHSCHRQICQWSHRIWESQPPARRCWRRDRGRERGRRRRRRRRARLLSPSPPCTATGATAAT
uniref:Uncharacterized protein n=1 Tax=Oryza glumipatula TaxID=40148 RepID=A0A0D9Z8U3_9ORYZ